MPTKGLLLVNLGSPRAPTRHDVRRYLNQFLMDPFVIDIPAVLRWPLVHVLITPRRSGKSAEAYQKIWTEQGSPLVEYTRRFAEGVRHQLEPAWSVRWAMRYGEPSIGATLRDWAVDDLYVVPLYPQYAESSSRSVIEEVRRSGFKGRLHNLFDFYAEPEFIKAQAAQITRHYNEFKPDQILLSFHGLPEHHMTKLHGSHCMKLDGCCDKVSSLNRWCYRAQSMATVKALKPLLPTDKVAVSFQSRLGRRPWLKPYTDHVIEEIALQGAKRVLVSCPSFVADCLETLEEIQLRLRDQFLAAGGEELQLTPALNAEPAWIEAFTHMIQKPELEWRP